ncbi:MAG: vWA domain-containing protein, partial [Orrella sp.]
EWKMQLTLAFTNPANREPVLFFEDKETVETLVDAEAPAAAFDPLVESLDNTGRAPGVLAREPDYAVTQQKNFYLLPIFEAEELYTQAGDPLRVLNVASVSQADDDPAQKEAAAVQSSLKAFSAAVVFVIDSTISMGPYIDRTRQAVSTITSQVEKAGLSKQVKFGLVAYRGSTEAVPGLEYVSQLFVDPTTVTSGDDFLKKIADLKPASVSSKSFDEDAYAGLETALGDIDWQAFGGRYIVLITDAGAIAGHDEYSTTKTDAAQLRLAAKEKGVAIYVLHLKTPAGKRNHQSAQAQYEDLGFNTIVNKPLYYPVNAGSVSEFGQMVDGLASSIVAQVQLANEGEVAVGSAASASGASGADPSTSAPNQLASLKKDAELMGYAMQLAYLGERQGTQAPSVFKAWVVDRDLTSPAKATTEVRVLMTKAQLSDMSSAVKTIVDAANQSHISPSVMFEQLRSVAATMGRDPNQINQGSTTRLSELGLLGEYIEGLPYRSDVLNLDEETWKSWSASQQQQFIRNLSSKLALYRNFNADLDRWVALAPDADPSENVYPVPLEALP